MHYKFPNGENIVVFIFLVSGTGKSYDNKGGPAEDEAKETGPGG